MSTDRVCGKVRGDVDFPVRYFFSVFHSEHADFPPRVEDAHFFYTENSEALCLI
jgi:hypothetical protein